MPARKEERRRSRRGRWPQRCWAGGRPSWCPRRPCSSSRVRRERAGSPAAAWGGFRREVFAVRSWANDKRNESKRGKGKAQTDAPGQRNVRSKTAAEGKLNLALPLLRPRDGCQKWFAPPRRGNPLNVLGTKFHSPR